MTNDIKSLVITFATVMAVFPTNASANTLPPTPENTLPPVPGECYNVAKQQPDTKSWLKVFQHQR